MPGLHDALSSIVVPIASSSSVPAPRVTTYDVAPVLKPYGRTPASVAAVTPSLPATMPPRPFLQLQLPFPFEVITISPLAVYPHVTVHDVWGVLRKFLQTPATREELNALSESARMQVKAAYFQRVSTRSPPDGLRRHDFLRGAVIMGVQPVDDDTVALALGKAP